MVGGAVGGWLVGWWGGAVETHGGSLSGATQWRSNASVWEIRADYGGP